jgi:LmbE family N-acetylglucosaminyl deacetylase
MFEDWPERYIAVVADRLPHQTVSVIGDLGLSVRLLSPAAAIESAHELGPCALVMLAAEALVDEDGRSLVSTIRSLSPYAPVTLLAKKGGAGDSALVQAMRAGASDVVDPANPVAVAELISTQLRIAGKHRERVLAIGAHPDDIEIGAAGALPNHRRRGDRISLLPLSRGGVGGHTKTRSTESIAAARAIGAQLLMADLSDTRIDDGIDTIRLIESVVSVLDPTIVYVHSRHDNHQDHRAVHTATVSATRGVPQLYGYQSPSASNDFTPTKFIPIDDVVVQKVDVLGLFDSQRERSYLEPELVVAGARYWARQLAPRSRYAEPFEVIRAAHHAVAWGHEQPEHPGSEAPIASVTRIPSRLPAGDNR